MESNTLAHQCIVVNDSTIKKPLQLQPTTSPATHLLNGLSLVDNGTTTTFTKPNITNQAYNKLNQGTQYGYNFTHQQTYMGNPFMYMYDVNNRVNNVLVTPTTSFNTATNTTTTPTSGILFKCSYDECDYQCVDSYSLIHHELTHSNTKPYKCPFCTYRSVRADNITVHKRIHTGEKPYKCQFDGCEYRCTQAGTLASHKRVHDGVRPYMCSHIGCGYRSTQASAVTRHCRSRHKDDPTAHWVKDKSNVKPTGTSVQRKKRKSTALNASRTSVNGTSNSSITAAYYHNAFSLLQEASGTATSTGLVTKKAKFLLETEDKYEHYYDILQPCDFLVKCIRDTIDIVFEKEENKK